MNDGQSAKQQIVEQIKQNSNILVTVSANPSVDELSAALGLTMMLNKLNKHATAVVSGAIPPAINFLDPEKTFENSVDSLRDFIIALDKEKADHLRYKVEGDVVKIFITPYKTTLSEADLDFSQGDYNVEVVLAMGVDSKDDLDKALEAHGRILHDATVATLTCGTPSTLGSISWNEAGASSVSEMLVSLSEALKSDKPLLDETVATALLTGIVASTDRFSNNLTSSKVMTMAAQLMAAGANQQLIAAKLEEAHEISGGVDDTDMTSDNRDGTTNLAEGESSKVDRVGANRKRNRKAKTPKRDDDGSVGGLAISHEREGSLDEVARDVIEGNQQDAAEHAEAMLAEQLDTVAPQAEVPSVIEQLAAEPVEDTPAPTVPMPALPQVEPILGGTLNATSEQAAEDKRRTEEKDRHRTILSHGAPIQQEPSFVDTPFNAAGLVDAPEPAAQIVPESAPVAAAPTITPVPAPNSGPFGVVTSSPFAMPEPTLADIDQQNRAPISDVQSDALAAVHAAIDAPQADAALPPLPPIFEASSQAPVIPPAPADLSAGLPALPDFSAPLPPPLPPAMPDASPFAPPVLPPAQPEQLGQLFSEPPLPVPVPDPTPADPSQFRIPGQ